MSNEKRGITRTSRKCPQCLGPHGIWRCPTFKGLALKDRLKVVKQGKLCRICLDEGHFASYLDRRDGEKGESCAVKTPLGWTIYGPMGESSEQVSISFTRSEYSTLEHKLEQMYNAEFDEIDNDVEEDVSIENRHEERILNKTTTLQNGHYQIGLPFKHNPPQLPDNLHTAEMRLKSLKSRMERNPDFRRKYTSVMEKYQAEGAARELTDEELKTLKPRWYLPHHAVWHPRKPIEPRVVFDCASKTNGTSLNDELLRGPKNTSSLIGVILRFRVDNIAVTADIKRMFHQVYVTPEDRDALCYLWWPGGDVSKAAKTSSNARPYIWVEIVAKRCWVRA